MTQNYSSKERLVNQSLIAKNRMPNIKKDRRAAKAKTKFLLSRLKISKRLIHHPFHMKEIV